MKNYDFFLIFAPKIDRGYTEAVLTFTHDLCFRAKLRKNVYHCKPQFYYIKVGYKGVYITLTCNHNARKTKRCVMMFFQENAVGVSRHLRYYLTVAFQRVYRTQTCRSAGVCKLFSVVYNNG